MAKPMLEIRVDDMDSVPVVYYKGERIEAEVSVSYDWQTRTDDRVLKGFGKHRMQVKYITNEPGALPVTNTIRHERV
jgi:hypothetical protein